MLWPMAVDRNSLVGGCWWWFFGGQLGQGVCCSESIIRWLMVHRSCSGMYWSVAVDRYILVATYWSWLLVCGCRGGEGKKEETLARS